METLNFGTVAILIVWAIAIVVLLASSFAKMIAERIYFKRELTLLKEAVDKDRRDHVREMKYVYERIDSLAATANDSFAFVYRIKKLYDQYFVNATWDEDKYKDEVRFQINGLQTQGRDLIVKWDQLAQDIKAMDFARVVNEQAILEKEESIRKRQEIIIAQQQKMIQNKMEIPDWANSELLDEEDDES